MDTVRRYLQIVENIWYQVKRPDRFTESSDTLASKNSLRPNLSRSESVLCEEHLLSSDTDCTVHQWRTVTSAPGWWESPLPPPSIVYWEIETAPTGLNEPELENLSAKTWTELSPVTMCVLQLHVTGSPRLTLVLTNVEYQRDWHIAFKQKYWSDQCWVSCQYRFQVYSIYI